MSFVVIKKHFLLRNKKGKKPYFMSSDVGGLERDLVLATTLLDLCIDFLWFIGGLRTNWS